MREKGKVKLDKPHNRMLIMDQKKARQKNSEHISERYMKVGRKKWSTLKMKDERLV